MEEIQLMATKIINTRLVTRNDTYKNWSTSNPVLLKGEVAIVTDGSLGASCYSAHGTTYIVVGDGVTAFNDLKPVSKDVFDSLSYHIKDNEKAINDIQEAIKDIDSDTLIDDDYYWGFDGSKGKKLIARAASGASGASGAASGTPSNLIEIDLADGTSGSSEPTIKLSDSVSISPKQIASENYIFDSTGISFRNGVGSPTSVTIAREYGNGTFEFPNTSGSAEGLGASGHFVLATTNETSELDTKINTTKTALEDKIKEQVASVFRFKGTVSDLTTLEAVENPVIGDVYHVTANHTEYVYATVDGSETASWEELGSSGLYALKTDLDAEIAERQELETNLDTEKYRALREEADIRANIDTEIADREAADETLANRIAAIEAVTTPVDGTTIVRDETTKIISVGVIQEANLSDDIKTKLNATTNTDSSLAIDDNDKLTVNEVSTDKLIQGSYTLVLDGGSSN